MLSNTQTDIINCAPLDLSDTSASNQPAADRIRFFNKVSHNIYPQDNMAQKLTHVLTNNISTNPSVLHQLELSSMTCGYPIGQFIIDTYCNCVLLYNWTINQFMEKSALFSNISKHNKQRIFIRSYLKQYLKFIYTPINNQIQHIPSIDTISDDDEIDDTIQPNHNINYKHDMRRIIYYISRFKFSLPNRPPRYGKKIFRQIDTIFLPKCGEIDAELLSSKGIEYKEMNANRLYVNMRDIEHLSRYDDFSRCVILVIGDDNTDIGAEKIYLFKMPIDDTATDIYNCSELPWIYNTRNNPQWLKDIVRECNGITFSYHVHSKDIQRVYISYESIDNQYYASRVFKHNIIDILKIFCNDININDIKLNKKEFKDIEYIEFVNTYFSDLKLMQYDNYYRMNELIKEYYERMGVVYKNKFIKYMNENGYMSDEQLEDMLGKNITDYNDCIIIEFDKQFPIQQTSFYTRNEDRECFIFHFMQHCYLYNTLPTEKELINKCFSTEHDDICIQDVEEHVIDDDVIENNYVVDCVPGDYGYKGEGGVVIMAYGRNNNNSQNSYDKPKKNNNQNKRNSNQYNRNNGNKKGGNKKDKNNNDDDKKDDDEKKNEDKKSKYKKPKDKRVKSLYRITRKLTKIIPDMITEPINDSYIYMIDMLGLLSVNNGIYELINADRIVNFGFHHINTGEILYGYAKRDPNSNRKYKWIFDDILYTADELKDKYEINATQLPISLQLHSYNIPKLTNNDIKSFINIKSWAKMNVYNIKTKETNKRKLTLSLTVDQFKKNLRKCHLNGVDDINLIPIFKDGIQYVWIITIDNGVDIGISFKCESNRKIVTGIYIDKQILLRQHMLVKPHKCDCLDKFVSNITHLEIGNVAEKENKLKDSQHRNNTMKKEIIGLKGENDILKQQNTNLQNENGNLRHENTDLNMELTRMKQELERYKVLAAEQKQLISENNTIETLNLTESKTFALPLDTTPLTDTEANQDDDDEFTPVSNNNNVNYTTKNLLFAPPTINLPLKPMALPAVRTMSSDISAQTPITPNIPRLPLQSSISNISIPASQPIANSQFQQQRMVSINSMNNQSMNVFPQQLQHMNVVYVPIYNPLQTINYNSYFQGIPPPEYFNQQISGNINILNNI